MRVAVVGAGPAGACTAAALASRGFDVLLADPAGVADPGTGRWRVGEGLPGAAGVHLRSLGVWEEFRSGGHLPCGGFLSRWGTDEPAFRSTLFDPYGPSWQLDRWRFDQLLRDAAVAAGARGPLPWRLVGARHEAPGWLLDFADDTGVRREEFDFVVDATGRRAAFARLIGVPRHNDGGLVAVAALLRDPDPENASSIVETTEDGWWYASRVPGGGLVAALFTDARACAEGGLAERPGWLRALGRAELVQDRTLGRAEFVRPLGGAEPARGRAPGGAELAQARALGGAELARGRVPGGAELAQARALDAGAPAGALRMAAAGSSRLARYAARDWLAVGDAACAHDPLASRGLFDALETGLAAAGCVQRIAAGDGRASGDYAAALAGGYADYLRGLAWFYRQEESFPASGFWQRHHATTPSPA